MVKRVMLFIVTNIAIVVTISIVFSLLGFAGFIGPDGGLMLVPLAVFSLIWGMGGAFISLQISRWMAKKAIERKTGARGLRAILEGALLDLM